MNWRPRAGEARPAWCVCGCGDAGLPRAGRSSSVGAANPTGPDGPVVAGGPVGPCGTFSPLFMTFWDR